MKKLPIGEQTLSELINSNALYVDKTKQIYDLIKHGRARYFFSRPRRFGKSLTCSTLTEIFSGNKELFSNLWIGQSDYKWKTYPVITFDFSGISHRTPEALAQGLHDSLNFYAEKYSIQLHQQGLASRFAELVFKIGGIHGPVVIIIDEYDKPLIDIVDNSEFIERSRNELKEFYGTLKSGSVDKYMHFLFVTGVSKFSKVSIFSELNNLDDLTYDNRAATLVGYTDQEIDYYFTEHIQALANIRKEQYEQTRQILKTWYNGYRFSQSDSSVYNPFSVHNCLTKYMLSNYWFSSGTPTFLMKFIQKNPLIASEIETIENSFISQSRLELFANEINDFLLKDDFYQNYKMLLLESGYLTFVSGYDSERRRYKIGCPNKEVRDSMTELARLSHLRQNDGQFSSFAIKNIF